MRVLTPFAIVVALFLTSTAGAEDEANPKWPAITVSSIRADETEAFAGAVGGLIGVRTHGTDTHLLLRLPGPNLPGTTPEVAQTAARLKKMGFADRDIIREVNKTPVKSLAQLTAAMNARGTDKPFMIRLNRVDGQPVMVIVQVEAAAAPPAEVADDGTVTVDGKALEQEYGNVDPLTLIGELQPRFWKSPDGKFIGVTSDNFSSFPIAQQVGVRNGDIVYSVNGVTLQSEADLIGIEDRIEEAEAYRVGIIRDGKPMTITVKVR